MTTPDPIAALLWFAAIAAAVVLVLWPKRGLVARLLRIRRMSARVRVEDALKHILNGELDGTGSSVVSLAGVLELSRSRAHDLTSALVGSGLVRSEEQGLQLTSDGRSYALRVLRTHRLLERFFADRTGLRPADWHDRAEAQEHAVTEAEAEALAARMGDPPIDPHGDPIPTVAGRLPPAHGLSLAGLRRGQAATVVHVEDEPESVYRTLVAFGFHPAVPVKVVGGSESEVRVLVEGRPVSVDRLHAAAVTVEPVAEADDHTVLFERLDVLAPGERAIVAQIAPAVQGAQRRRLLDLGVLPGTVIVAEVRSPSGDPVAYRIRGALIALRRAQAQGIYIRRPPSELADDGSEAEAAA